MIRLIVIVVTCISLVTPVGASTLRVSAAASLSDVLEEIAETYQQTNDVKIRFNFGGSAMLARQIELGAPADVFISADEEKMTILQGRGWVLGDTRVSLLSNRLVIIVPNDSDISIKKISDIATAQIKRLSLAEPNTVPAGIYARKLLDGHDLWDVMKGRIIPTDNVRAALLAVANGNVDAGIVYRTDAMISDRVRVAYEIKPGEGPYISYSVAVLSESLSADEGAKFIAFLRSDRVGKIFERHGFVLPPR